MAQPTFSQLVATEDVIAILPGTGKGTFGEPLATVTFGSQQRETIVVADFNRDGRPDFAVCVGDPGTLHVAWQDAAGSISTSKAGNPNAISYGSAI